MSGSRTYDHFPRWMRDPLNVKMDHGRLAQTIKMMAESSIDLRQIASRYRKLVPSMLNQLKLVRMRELDRRQLSSRQLRSILTGQDYLDLNEKLVELRYQAHLARIQYESHMMLWMARKSISSLASAQANSRTSTRPQVNPRTPPRSGYQGL